PDVCEMVFRPDGSQLACACKDGTVRVWDMATGKAIHTFKAPTPFTADSSSVAYSSDGQRLASAGPAGVKIWDPVTGHEICTLTVRRAKNWPYRVAFSPDGSYLATVDGEGVKIWEAAIGGPTESPKRLGNPRGRRRQVVQDTHSQRGKP